MDEPIREKYPQTFTVFDWVEYQSQPQACTHDGLDAKYPCSMTLVKSCDSDPVELPGDDDVTHFVFAVDDESVWIEQGSETRRISHGMYACVVGKAAVDTEGRALVMSRHGYRGLFMLGGPVEEQGRLKYIDGCTDTLLVSPVMLGDPCLNLLYFPPGIDQTFHTHPSARLGIVLSGRGICRLPEGEVDLLPGVAFYIKPDGVHAFATENEPMRVLAFHPDSDFGPSHESHPMLNRTIIDGVSAADASRAKYRTK